MGGDGLVSLWEWEKGLVCRDEKKRGILRLLMIKTIYLKEVYFSLFAPFRILFTEALATPKFFAISV